MLCSETLLWLTERDTTTKRHEKQRDTTTKRHEKQRDTTTNGHEKQRDIANRSVGDKRGTVTKHVDRETQLQRDTIA